MRECGGVPTKQSLQAIDRLRAAGEPKLPAPLKDLLANARSGRPSFPKVSDELYEYTPLPTANSIRLLQIHGEDDQGLIHCSLRTVELDSGPLYNCLSYTWGSPLSGHEAAALRETEQDRDYSTQWPISCNGKTHFVNQNLYDVLKTLPKNPVQFEREPSTQTTVLHRAAARGSEPLVFSALICAADLNSLDAQGKTPLHHAAEHGHLTIVEALLEEGSNPALTDMDGMTALGYAERNQHHKVVELVSRHSNVAEGTQKRNMPVFAEATFFWVDALCLNQNDLAERSQQILLMSRIYREARTVIAWLGPKDEFTRLGTRTIRTIARQYQKYGDSDIVPYRDVGREAYEKAGIPYISPQEWVAVAMIYMRTWFTRAWVLQESILANDLLMFCGSTQIVFDDLAVTTEALWKRDLASGVPSVAFLLRFVDQPIRRNKASIKRLEISRQYSSAIEYNFYVMMRLKMRWIYDRAGMDTYVPLDDRNASLSFPSLIYHAWGLDCKEPHDKVYSLLSLVKPGPVSFDVIPDYTKPVEELYAMVTKEIFKAQGHFNHLSTLNDRSVANLTNLPSWVPDYSVAGHAMMFNNLYSAAGQQSKAGFNLEASEWNILCVRGMHIDTIDALGQSNRGANTQLYYDPTWWSILLNVPQPYKTGEARSEALFRTLIMGRKNLPSELAREPFHRLLMGMICAEAEKEDTADAVRSASLAHILFSSMSYADESQKAQEGGTGDEHVPVEPLYFSAPDEGLDGPYYAPIRESLNTMEAVAQAEEPSTSFIPTLVDLEAFRANGTGRLWESYRSNLLEPDAVGNNVSRSVMERLARRKLFKTQGGMLGLGSVSMQEGDEVWVLEGTAMPYVLRKEGEAKRRTLIAAAYVHGIMNGEGVEGREEEWERIKIE